MQPTVIYNSIFLKYPNILSAFSTMIGGSNDSPFCFNLSYNVGDLKDYVDSNWDFLCKKLNIDRTQLVYEEQTHSSNIAYVDKPVRILNNDGLITDVPNLFLVVFVADCIPVHIYDKKKKIVASIHSGWQGTQLKILEKCIQKLQNDFRCEPKDLLVYQGPSICGNCFETDEDVAVLFHEKFVIQKGTKFQIELKGINNEILLKYNVPKENILNSKLCTYSQKKFLHSYRRDKSKSGRMAGVIGIRN